MALQIKRTGFGQVEPNHLAAQTDGQIYAQLPASTAIDILENGRFVKYDYASGEVNTTGAGEWMLVFNEIKLYDPRQQMYKDYAMQRKDFMDGEIVPRVFKTSVGDIFTTNTFGPNTSASATVAGETLSVGDKVIPAASGTTAGYLTKSTATTFAAGVPVFQVVKEYNLGDMQPAVKLQRIQ